jgi:hypothetical protein
MNWTDVAKIIAPLAPMAGSILGGLIPFPGGSLIGEEFGKIIAGVFGVPATPDAVNAAVTSNPNEVVLAKINQATELARIKIDGFADLEKAYLHTVETGLSQTGDTMRADIGHESLFFTGWRPAIGWVFVFEAVCFGLMLSVAAGAAAFFNNSRPLEILTNAWPIFLAYFGTLGLMVGVYIPSRTAEKKAAIANNAAMPNATVITPTPPVVIAKPALKPAVIPAKPATARAD